MSIEARVLEFIRAPGGEAAFAELALEVFAHQYARVPMYRAFCDARRADPTQVHTYEAIPALPADAFKHGLCTVTAPVREFLSSGTTGAGELRSRHALASLVTYETSAMRWFDAMVMADTPGPSAVLVLGPTAATHPHSSLGQMFTWCVERSANGDVLAALDAEGRADIGSALAWLEARAAASAPVLVLAVSSALTALLEAVRDRGAPRRLPADSRIVDTGGRKGGARVMSAAGLLTAAWRWLHVPAYLCVNEYGMTEMLSQFYDDALESRVSGRLTRLAMIAPPWVRTRIVDPASLEPLPQGETGLLRHFDLANWESVSALQTLDLGRSVGRGFELCGRAEGTDTRGCSALVAEVVRARDSGRE